MPASPFLRTATALAAAAAAIVACGADRPRPPGAGTRAAVSDARPGIPFEGRIVFQSDAGGDAEIVLLTSAGGAVALTDNAWQDEYPRWSPDGTKIAFSANPDGVYGIYVMDADGRNVRRVVRSDRDAGELAWSPDGTRLAYTTRVRRPLGRRYDLRVVELATGRDAPLAPAFKESSSLPDWSPDGAAVAFTGKRLRGWDVFRLDLPSGAVRALTEEGTCRPRWSPDGTRLAYVSHEADGKGDVFVMAADGSGKRRLTARGDTFDYFPAWSPDGRMVAFCSNAKSMYAAEGDWDLYVADAVTGAVKALYAGPGRDVFPDWRR